VIGHLDKALRDTALVPAPVLIWLYC